MTLYDPHFPGQTPSPSDWQLEPPRRPRARRRRVVPTVIGLLVVCALAAAGVWAANNQQYIADQVTVWQFEPGAAVLAHEKRLRLTEHGIFLYRASQPIVSATEEFATECPQQEDEAAYGILGCYFPSTKLIYLFDVTDERLDGTEEVTAAHEMLHAAWDRMSAEKRTELASLLEVEYVRLSTDPAFVERMEFYARTEPGQRANELHSIIGTEATGISAALEEHYALYFIDRTIVTGLHATSNVVFRELQTRSESLVASLDDLRASIEADYTAYTTGYAALNADVTAHNTMLETAVFTSQAEVDAANARRAALIDRKTVLDELYTTIAARQVQYESLRAELAAVNATSAELQQGLNIGGEADSDPVTTTP